ncbi:DJ-1/PfpI family protein [Mycoplasma sp. MV126]|uniref:DJ-1/PfpI family protein n=1 Tax=Mycoplasma sp. MV126 TaxID=3401676 RepID=UPI003AAEB39C
MKLKLLVIIEDKFNDVELTSTLSVLKAADVIESITYYAPEISSATGQFDLAHVDNIVHQYNLEDYNAIFIPGGKGCQTLRNNPTSLDIIKEFYQANKYLFAICDAPNVLMEAKILPPYIHYSSYPSQWSLPTRGSNRSDEMTSCDGKIITGKNAFAAPELGLRIIHELFSEELSLRTYIKINGDQY